MGSVDFRPLFIADWLDVVFVHFRVDARKLQPHVPFELDTFAGDAYVSLVAFTQRNLRPIALGRLGALLGAPLATHGFLNLRTYVQVGEERGIYFIAEWIPNRLAVLIGPQTYGLPYRMATLRYRTDVVSGRVEREIRARGRFVRMRGEIRSHTIRCTEAHTFDHFVTERYAAFTSRADDHRRFRVLHEPWSVVDVTLRSMRFTLLEDFPWFAGAQLVAAHYSTGVRDVRISRPEPVASAPERAHRQPRPV